MGKKRNPDWYWPLGLIDYHHEVHYSFPEEAQILGVITILWNQQELALKRLFVKAIRADSVSYAEAIWDRQTTHQAKRDLLALAIDHAALTEKAKGCFAMGD